MSTEAFREGLNYAAEELQSAGDDIDQVNVPLYGDDGTTSVSEKANHVVNLALKLNETLPQLLTALRDTGIYFPGITKQVNDAHNLYTSAGLAGQTSESRRLLSSVSESAILIDGATGMLRSALDQLTFASGNMFEVARKNALDLKASIEKTEIGTAKTLASIEGALEAGEELGREI